MVGLDLAVLLAASRLVNVTIMDFDLVEGRNLDQLVGLTCRDVNLRGCGPRGQPRGAPQCHRPRAGCSHKVAEPKETYAQDPHLRSYGGRIGRACRRPSLGASRSAPASRLLSSPASSGDDPKGARQRRQPAEKPGRWVLSIRPPVQPRAYSATLGPGAQRQATGHLHHVPPYRSEFGGSVRT